MLSTIHSKVSIIVNTFLKPTHIRQIYIYIHIHIFQRVKVSRLITSINVLMLNALICMYSIILQFITFHSADALVQSNLQYVQ